MSAAVLTPTLPLHTEIPHDALQRRLSRLSESRLRPRTAETMTLEEEIELRRLELSFVEAQRAAIASLAGAAPDDPSAFMAWYEALRENGPGQNDPLFPWLAEEASLEQLRWFLSQEVAGEAGFDDLVALTQLKMPVRAKLELARNYWDEMGRGNEAGMHGPMLERLAHEAGLADRRDPIVWEATALGNLLVALAANRSFAWQSIGALGAIELTAPTRAGFVNRALERLRFDGHARQYYALHATIDIRHSAAWNEEVIEPLVQANPALTQPIAEGALMRLAAGARCFERYRREFGI